MSSLCRQHQSLPVRLAALLLIGLLAVVAHADGPSSGAHFARDIVARERNFFRAGVAYDRVTGMTFDGHRIDRRTGELKGRPRSFSAPSKESLHLILLAKTLSGNTHARNLLAPTPDDRHGAVQAALDVLGRKISTYEKFDREHPGFGGFLPWYRVGKGKIEPDAAWARRVPGLDNGQLAWSMYLVANTLESLGHAALAARYQAHFDLMKKNVVPIFYDPEAKQLRTETTLAAGSAVSPQANHYLNHQPDHFLDDDKEGLMLVHFADLFGDWKGKESERAALWRTARRIPVVDRGLTVPIGDTFSPHEDWGHLVLPYRDLPLAQRLFLYAQKGRTRDAAQHHWIGLRAATHVPIVKDQQNLDYINTLGVASLARGKVTDDPIFTPYAAYPLALAKPRMFRLWLGSMLGVPGMWGKNGIGESYADNGELIAPILTWDGKGLLLVAMMGGVTSEIRSLLKRDGLYERFMERTRHDYRAFQGHTISGQHLGWSEPTPPTRLSPTN